MMDVLSYLATSDDRTSKGGSKEIDPLVDGVGLHSRVDQLFNKLALDILCPVHDRGG